ncbi:MAG: hypothetical protein Q8L68_01460 [Methylococcales bacterium]|nr:hypothetical protein [Methylococcales bacterium]
MPTNNSINVTTSSSGWTAFTTSITAVTTNPVLGSGATTTSFYLQYGKMLFLNFSLINTTLTTAGSGTYIFNMPDQFTIDRSRYIFANSPTISGTMIPLGAARGFAGTVTGVGSGVYTNTVSYSIVLLSSFTENSNLISSTFFPLNTLSFVSVDLLIPIV